MPKHKSRTSIYSIEKRLTILLMIVILLMFAFTPFILVFNRNNNEKQKNDLITGINNESNQSATSETVIQTLSSSNSDILTSSKPILNNVVDAAKASTINTIQNLKLSI